MSDIIVHEKDHAFFRVTGDPGVLMELSDFFTFDVPGAQFTPSYRAKVWDGKYRLFNPYTGDLPVGLYQYLKEFCERNTYTIEFTYDVVTPDSTDEALLKYFSALPIYAHGERITIRDYQMRSAIHAIQKNRTILLSPTACQDGDDKVLMYSGEWKKMRDIRVGDKIMSPYGDPKKVKAVFSGEDEMYRVLPNEGEPITVTHNHLLSLRATETGRIKYGQDTQEVCNVEVSEWQKWAKSRKHIRKLWYSSAPKVFEHTSTPPTILSPYFVGIYLGDGHTRTIALTTADFEIRNAVFEEMKKFPTGHIRESLNGSKAKTYHLSFEKGVMNQVAKEFESLGLTFRTVKNRTTCAEKHIPEVYQTSDIDTRIELLSGIIDSDGCLNTTTGRSYEIVSKSERLVENINRLSLGLGIRTKVSEKIINSKKYFRIMLKGVGITRLRTRVAHKKIAANMSFESGRMQYGLTGFSVESIGRGKFFGLTVEDSLYITNGGMVTHNSGKSAIIYLIARWHQHQGRKTLIIVPTTSLCHQMFGDFKEYSSMDSAWDVNENVGIVMGGKEKSTNKPIIVATWQSIYKQPPSYFSQYESIIGDEAHLFSGKSLTTIMNKAVLAKFRVGTTGTLDGTKTHELVLTGLFGPVRRVTTTRELMDAKQLAELNITCLQLGYSDADRKAMKGMNYQQEIDWIVTHPKRNTFISNLALKQTGNTLLLFQYVEKHGKVLFEMLKERKDPNRKVFFIHGKVEAEVRDHVRKITEHETDAIIVASNGVFSTGTNIRNLHSIIFASPSKSRVRNLQSIGRGLRRSDTKDSCELFDIGDDLSWKTKKNHTLRHMIERIKIYNTEKFNYKIIHVPLTK
jgi:intein/homing endonuclease